MENRMRRARITLWEADGDYIRVTFTREDGQRVTGMYHRFGWDQAPREVVREMIDMTSRPPIKFVGGRGRAG